MDVLKIKNTAGREWTSVRLIRLKLLTGYDYGTRVFRIRTRFGRGLVRGARSLIDEST